MINNRALILIGASLLHATSIGAGYMSLPPLFTMIVEQEGWAMEGLQRSWSYIPLGSGLFAILAGYILRSRHDRLLVLGSALVTIFALLIRVQSPDIFVFSLSALIYGAGSGFLLVVLTNRISQTFTTANAGLAQAVFFGAYTIGAALAFALSEYLLGLLGGWRNIFLFWAVLSVVSVIPAAITNLPPPTPQGSQPLDSDERHLWRKGIVPYALAYGCYVGGYLGVTGLLPSYLRLKGWVPSIADLAVASTSAGFLIGAALLAYISDRWGNRVKLLTTCLIVNGLATALLAVAAGPEYPALGLGIIFTTGLLSGAMALFFPIVADDPRTGGAHASKSIGIATAASYAGGFIVPFSTASLSTHTPELALSVFAISSLASAYFVFVAAR